MTDSRDKKTVPLEQRIENSQKAAAVIRRPVHAYDRIRSLEERNRKLEALVKELADDLESEIEGRRSSELDRRIDRDLTVVREARQLLETKESVDE